MTGQVLEFILDGSNDIGCVSDFIFLFKHNGLALKCEKLINGMVLVCQFVLSVMKPGVCSGSCQLKKLCWPFRGCCCSTANSSMSSFVTVLYKSTKL